MDDSAAIAERHVFEAIDAAMARFHIAPQRIFLGGLENGGTLAYRIAAQCPEKFAGVLSIGGSFPASGQPFGCLTQLRHVPVFVAQGRDSVLYPVDQLCNDLRLMHTAGLSITVRQYPCGDELNSLMLRDMDAWMMEIVTGKVATPARTALMMDLLKRDYGKQTTDTDDQGTGFTGIALKGRDGFRMWSKAGWTSTTRHDVAYIETPDGGIEDGPRE